MAGRKTRALGALAAAALAVTPASAGAAVPVNVQSHANVFAAGLSSVPLGVWQGGDGHRGILPPSVALDGATTIYLESVTGLWKCAPSRALHGPDGTCWTPLPNEGTDLTSPTNISGFLAPTNGVLAGVFLGPDAPTGPQPGRIDFKALGHDFVSLSPAPKQLFFMGDGRTSSNSLQFFEVPAGATRLFLGMPDGGTGMAFNGAAGFYGDNSGAFDVLVSSVVVDCLATTTGTPGNDVVSLGSTNDAYDGLAGNDTITPGSGDDCVLGSEGNDIVSPGSGADEIHGGEGDDTLAGGSGNDRITGGPGNDSIDAGSGHDRIDSRDGSHDYVDCGGDYDRYRADAFDTIAANCEQSSEIL